MPPGELITRWTVRLALICYFAAIILRLGSHQPGAHRSARIIFTLGCGLFIAHVIAAFHFFHHWSHADAYEATRRESREVAGFDSGFGLWLNYLFTLLWVGETALWWRGNDQYPRRRWRAGIVHGFMLFMVFSATAVFETGPVRWLGLAGCVAAIALALRTLRDARR